MTTTSNELAQVRAELDRIQAEQERPAQLAARLAVLERQQAQETAKRQAVLAYYNDTIQAQHRAERARLANQRAELLEQYDQVRAALDALIAGVKEHDRAAMTYVNECATDEAAGGLLVGRRVNHQAIADLLDAVAWQAQHEAMLHLLTVINSEADIENFASRHLVAVSMLRAGWLRRFSLEYAGQVMSRITDPQARVTAWAQNVTTSLAGSS